MTALETGYYIPIVNSDSHRKRNAAGEIPFDPKFSGVLIRYEFVPSQIITMVVKPIILSLHM